MTLLPTTINCQFEHESTVNFAVQQCHVPLVKRLTVSNIGTVELRQLTITIDADPKFMEPWEIDLTSLPAGETIDLGVIDPLLSASFFAELNEQMAGLLTIRVANAAETIYLAQSNISLLAHDEWNGIGTMPEIIAAFVMPNQPAIATVLQRAAEILLKWSGDSALDGYIRQQPERVKLQLAAIYHALQEQRISYALPPASFEKNGQKIRTPAAIFQHKLATCLDLSLLYAACAEAIGLHPLIVFTEGHAFPAVWLEEATFPDSLQDDITLLTKRIADGVNEIVVLESTALAADQPINFDDAVKVAEAKLQNPQEFHFFIDIARARAARILPLPSKEDVISGGVFAAPDYPPIPSGTVPLPEQLTGAATLENNANSEKSRLQEWERRLLDLSLRNQLLNFRLSGANIPLFTTDLSKMEDSLAKGDDFQLYPRPTDWEAGARNEALYRQRKGDDPRDALINDEFIQHRLRADLTDKELDTRLTKLYRAARTSLEENGANTLYLALGLLCWYETPQSQKPRYAPILMLPMEIVRKSVKSGYTLRQREDEAQLNITLLEMLRQNFAIDISSLQSLPVDENGIDVTAILTAFRRAIMSCTHWDILESGYLGLFSFNKFVMWHDLRERSDDLKRNQMVASLMAGNIQWQPATKSIAEEQLDETYSPADILCPMSADSSQLSAICAAGEEQSIVLHGPPGTGKSQTITNIIAHLLAQGKNVLFVAEKMAALTVVQQRLTQLGLQPFCLEVHSNKSNKREVLDQLRIALEINNSLDLRNWQQEAQRIADLRAELNAYVHALHCPRNIGLSIFQALAKLSTLHGIRWKISFPAEQTAKFTAENTQQIFDIARSLRVAGENCGHPCAHPWADAHCSEYHPQLPAKLIVLLTAFQEAVQSWKAAHTAVADLFNITTDNFNYQQLLQLHKLADCFAKTPTIPTTLLLATDWQATDMAVANWVSNGKRRDELRKQIFARYKEGVLEINFATLRKELSIADEQWILPRQYKHWKITSELRTFALAPKMKIDDLASELANLADLDAREKYLRSESDNARALLGVLWHDGETDWEEIAEAVRWSAATRAIVFDLYKNNKTDAFSMLQRCLELVTDIRSTSPSTAQQILAAFVTTGDVVITAWEELKLVLLMEDETLNDEAAASNCFTFITNKVSEWQKNIDRLKEWCSWQRQRAAALAAGLAPLVSCYETYNLPHEAVEATLTNGIYQSWVEEEIVNDPVLTSFSRALFEDKIRLFRELDDKFAELIKSEIQLRLATRLASARQNPALTAELNILNRELQKQRRHMALRKLFQQIPNLLATLKPCLLMSPISVAQYLDPSHPPFDLVIFDEASQVPTCDAVGAIARGQQAFIVGDPKQLPPTNFFSAMQSVSDDDYPELEDLESILDDCLAIRVPEKRLRWHYRSRHESLIAFSNHRYYDDQLFTFPAPDELTPFVQLIQVDGVYDRGNSKQNRLEGEAVIAEIVRRLRDPQLSSMTIGVVTFSQPQQQLIEDLLDEMLRNSPELETFFSPDVREAVFVKNLENVQGDERDVILFSIGYGTDSTGRVSMNFGPLNQEGGWRRLNVAVTRARQEMLIFSSLRPDQLDCSRTKARGVADLKAFLEYAQISKTPYKKAPSQQTQAKDNEFEQLLASKLQEQGHQVVSRVGCSGYRIDIAIIDPNNPDRFILGIECDGATYQQAKTARDRDKLREAVLRNLGWKIHRVWSTDWWENPERELARIVEAIEEAKEANQKT